MMLIKFNLHVMIPMLLVGFVLLFLSSCSGSRSPITIAVINAKIWTGNPDQPLAEALAIAGNKIMLVGTNEEIIPLIQKNTRAIDARGCLVTPGFIDSHLHFIEGGFRLSSVQLRTAKSKAAFIERIKALAEDVGPGVWITGGDWDHENWGGELPHRNWIDAVTPQNPVWINRLDGHMALANSAALDSANITKDTPEVEGGTIVRDTNGEVTGILKDNAMSLVDRVVPEPPDQLKDRALAAAMKYVNEQGVTSIQHMGSWDDLAVFARARAAAKLSVRISAAVPLATWDRLQEKIQKEGPGDHWLRIGGLKGFVDGSLGSHTAAFFEPFNDAPADSGLLVNEPDELYQWIANGDNANLQIIVHAIGDRANHIILDLYERVRREHGSRDRRFRVEHAQHLTANDIPRFKELEVIASMQPYHAIDDGRWAEKFIGKERCQTTYAFRSLLDCGVRLVFGSDWYVAPPTPLEGIYAAVTRRTLDGKNPHGWIPEQKITVAEALQAYTGNAAYASFEEHIKGTLAPGKLADFVIIDRDLFAIPAEEIADARIILTAVDGKIVYERE